METVLLFLANIVLPYLIMSFLCMIVLELLSVVFNIRGRLLQRTIRRMLGTDADTALFYKHPLIQSLTHGSRPPAYIPGRLFAAVLYDALGGRNAVEGTSRLSSSLGHTLTALFRFAGMGANSPPSATGIWT